MSIGAASLRHGKNNMDAVSQLFGAPVVLATDTMWWAVAALSAKRPKAAGTRR